MTNKEFTKTFASVMKRPSFIPVPRIVLNSLFNEERAKVTIKSIFQYVLLQLTFITIPFQIMLEGQKVVPKRVKELGFQYQYPDINTACIELIQKNK